MTRPYHISALFTILALFFAGANAGDFDWLKSLEVEAQSDRSGFNVTLSTRFHVGGTQINAVISNVDRPSDAYMVLRLGEISHRPVSQVLQVYRTHRKRGWGVMAKKLGIKPGSREFHALKRGHDLKSANRAKTRHKKTHGGGMGKGRGNR